MSYFVHLSRADLETLTESPGKFEGSQAWVPYYWELGLNGGADQDDGETFTFELGPEDFEVWDELQGFTEVRVWEDSNGFVYGEVS